MNVSNYKEKIMSQRFPEKPENRGLDGKNVAAGALGLTVIATTVACRDSSDQNSALIADEAARQAADRVEAGLETNLNQLNERLGSVEERVAAIEAEAQATPQVDLEILEEVETDVIKEAEEVTGADTDRAELESLENTDIEEEVVAETPSTEKIEENSLDVVSTTTVTTTETISAPSGEASYWDQPYASAAEGENSMFQLMDSDSNVSEIDLSAAEGFTPDSELRLSDIEPKVLDPIPDNAADFQAYLNAELNGFPPLAGYTDGTNDYNQYSNHESGPQVPMYSWMVHTGEYAELPGIGRVEGGPGRAVLVLIINRTDNVYRFPTNSVHVEAGFQGWGRIWNGEPDHVQETEQRLINHYRARLGQGVPETGFIGQCDLPENCEKVTVVTVERMQWGNHEDGTPRYQFRLIRAETVSTP